MADPMMLEFELADIARARGDAPDGFADLVPGQVAKLLFDFRTEQGQPVGSESMWVEVTEVHDHEYVGKLRNASIYADMPFGDLVDFEARHVIGIAA